MRQLERWHENEGFETEFNGLWRGLTMCRLQFSFDLLLAALGLQIQDQVDLRGQRRTRWKAVHVGLHICKESLFWRKIDKFSRILWQFWRLHGAVEECFRHLGRPIQLLGSVDKLQMTCFWDLIVKNCMRSWFSVGTCFWDLLATTGGVCSQVGVQCGKDQIDTQHVFGNNKCLTSHGCWNCC